MQYSSPAALHKDRPAFLRPALKRDTSFNVKIDAGENLLNTWHYHPEVELILLRRTGGIRMIGNNTERFTHNDTFLIGKNIPHAFFHQNKHFGKKNSGNASPHAVVIQFDEDFMGKEFLSLPELQGIQNLFRIARQGLSLTPYSKNKVIPLMDKMLDTSPMERIIILLEIIRLLADKNAYQILMKEDVKCRLKEETDERIQTVMHYTKANFDQNITIEQVAKLVHLTRVSFCRYFKMQTGRTYMNILIELRIRKACQMLRENKDSIKDIGYACGFDSPSNFHYKFKNMMKQSPLEYRIHFLSKLQNFGIGCDPLKP